MPEQTTQFRTALNGYHREDVVAYIDRMIREHEEIKAQLQDRIMHLQEQLDAANEALAAAEEDVETKQALADATDVITDLRERNQTLEARVQELEEALQAKEEAAVNAPQPETVNPPVSQDLEDPIPPVANVLPVELAASRDFTELELAAYRRAELAERMARERAGDVYRQIQSIFNQANTKLGTGKSDLEQLVKALSSDATQLLILLTNLNNSYQNAETSFAELGEQNRRILEGEF